MHAVPAMQPASAMNDNCNSGDTRRNWSLPSGADRTYGDAAYAHFATRKRFLSG